MQGAIHIEGALDARGLKVAIVAGRWNDFIISSLLKGACASWARHGGAAGDRQRAALTEVVLHVDDDQRPHVSTVDRLLHFAGCRSVRTRV